MITGINESKTLTKYTSCQCKCNFDGKCHVCEKYFIGNPSTCSCKNGKYLASIIVDSVITCDEIIEPCDEETKTIPRNFNEKQGTCKTQNLYNLLAFLSITTVISNSSYCYLIKYRAKQKHLLPFHVTKISFFTTLDV